MTIQSIFSNANPASRSEPICLPVRSLFPEEAHAVIYKPARAATTSGKARTRGWKMRFERRTVRFIEPLMGWTGGGDPLTQVELSFPSPESAIAYARRQGLQYTVRGFSRQQVPQLRLVRDTGRKRETRPWRLEWVERTLGPDLIRKGFGPSPEQEKNYADPQDILRDPDLSESQKRERLRRWALDSYLIEVALANGEPQTAASRLPEVINALIDLDAPSQARARGGAPSGASASLAGSLENSGKRP